MGIRDRKIEGSTDRRIERSTDRKIGGSTDRVVPVLKAIGKAIRSMEEPAVEKIAEDTREDPFQVLIATLLSAQTKDAVTAAASARLFAVANTPAAMAALPVSRIQKLIYPVSFYRNKAQHVKDACRRILDAYGGVVPDTMDELLTLAGVGRKTANLVLILSHASKDNICVDTHVHRISNLLGWVKTRTPDETEQALYRVVPKKWWPDVNLYLVTWGQNVCKPVYPKCSACVVADKCPSRRIERSTDRRIERSTDRKIEGSTDRKTGGSKDRRRV